MTLNYYYTPHHVEYFKSSLHKNLRIKWPRSFDNMPVRYSPKNEQIGWSCPLSMDCVVCKEERLIKTVRLKPFPTHVNSITKEERC